MMNIHIQVIIKYPAENEDAQVYYILINRFYFMPYLIVI